MSDRNVIECKDVVVRYGPVTVLDGVTFSIPERETLCVVGPNGGGKSTLLKVLLGLVKPQAGKVRVLGMDPAKARQHVGYMPQYIQIDPLFPIDVEGIVRMGRLKGNRFGFYSKDDHAATQRALQEVGLWEQRKEAFMNLSGGMKQRVLIARALVNDPQLLLLDEPTAMVDAHIEAKLLEHLQELHNKMTILLVSHDASFVANLVDEVLCINRTAELHPVGRVAGEAVQELYGEPVKAVLHDHGHGKCECHPEHGKETSADE
ncbi:MAG: metal ABC transporter ATP-binding protein [Puniceicoccaceae bacterium]